MKYCILVSFTCLLIINLSSCERDGKFIAALVSFPSDQCNVDNDIGVCFSKKKCTRMGGKNLGTCAHGYGQCCKFTAQCDANEDTVIVTRNLTTLATPTVLPRTCMFSFPRQPGVCQLRLDFPKLNLNEAEPNGNCVNDSLSITGSVTVKELNICGMGAAAANHMYLDYGSSDNIQIRLRTLGMIGMISMYGYEIRVTQIKCNSARRVPQDCLQYYTDRTGVVTSYNYPRQQLNNENYRVCIEKQSAGDRIEWRLCNGTNLPESPYNNPDNLCLEGEGCGPQPQPSPPSGPAGPGGPVQGACALDYIEIPGAMPNTRFCKHPFPASVISENFWMLVHFDEIERQTMSNPLPDSELPCSSFDAANLASSGYKLVPTDTNGCSFKSFDVDIGNKGFCLAYTVL